MYEWALAREGGRRSKKKQNGDFLHFAFCFVLNSCTCDELENCNEVFFRDAYVHMCSDFCNCIAFKMKENVCWNSKSILIHDS
jgi:hypothetical protein